MPEYIDVSTAAQRLRMSYQRVLTRVMTGEIEGLRIGGRWKVLAASVEEYAGRQASTAPRAPA